MRNAPDPASLRHSLRNALAVAQAAVRQLKLEHSAQILDDLIDAVGKELRGDDPRQKFKPGDFVIMNQGMGNVEFGTVNAYHGDGRYVIDTYDYNGRHASYVSHANEGDMQASTPEQGDEYYDAMTMTKVKLWVSKP